MHTIPGNRMRFPIYSVALVSTVRTKSIHSTVSRHSLISTSVEPKPSEISRRKNDLIDTDKDTLLDSLDKKMNIERKRKCNQC